MINLSPRPRRPAGYQAAGNTSTRHALLRARPYTWGPPPRCTVARNRLLKFLPARPSAATRRDNLSLREQGSAERENTGRIGSLLPWRSWLSTRAGCTTIPRRNSRLGGLWARAKTRAVNINWPAAVNVLHRGKPPGDSRMRPANSLVCSSWTLFDGLSSV